MSFLLAAVNYLGPLFPALFFASLGLLRRSSRQSAFLGAPRRIPSYHILTHYGNMIRLVERGSQWDERGIRGVVAHIGGHSDITGDPRAPRDGSALLSGLLRRAPHVRALSRRLWPPGHGHSARRAWTRCGFPVISRARRGGTMQQWGSVGQSFVFKLNHVT